MPTTHSDPHDPKHAAAGAAGATGATGATGGEADELIHVPKGRSRMQFVILVGMLILMLVTFVVSGPIVGMFQRAGGQAVATWRHPTRGLVEIEASEFFLLKEHLAELRGRQSDVEDADVLRLLVVDRLAQDAGVEVSDVELAEHIGQFAEQIGGVANYRAWTQRMRGGTAAFESTLRSALRAGRYQMLLGTLSAHPTPSEVEEAWHADHEELAFELIQQPLEPLREEARAALPADAELEAWYAALPEAQKSGLKTQTRWRAEVAGVSLSLEADAVAGERTFDAAALVAKYPPAADVDAEQEARAYFDNYRYLRFARPEPAADPEATEPPPPPASPFFEYDEVAERARYEAPIHAALVRWVADMASRESAGTAVDLAAEAEALGLGFAPADTALSAAEWREHEPLGGMYMVGQLSMLQPGKLSTRLVVDPNGLIVPRLIEKLDPTLPPLAEVRERVAELWVSEEAGKRAVAKLDALRDGFRPEDAAGGVDPAGTPSASAEAFAAAAAEAGLALLRRDWRDKSAPASGPAALEPAQQFVGSNGALNALAVDEVAGAALDAAKENAYLARLAGRRPVDLARMGPGDYESYLSRPILMARFTGGGEDMFSQSALEARYELRMASQRADE
jgi:hypothetical protein